MRRRDPISLGRFPWIADTVYQLATSAAPPVTCQFREEILAEKIKPELREEMEAYPPRLELLKAQESDGSWADPENDAEPFFTVVQKLLHLHDLGVRRDADEVKRAVKFLGKAQNADGSFPLNVHHTAFALWVLTMFGFGKSPAAKKTLTLFEKSRRGDSGWLDPKLEPTLAADPDAPSCPWTTLHVLLALTEFPEQRRDLEVRRGALFLLDRMFKRSHKSFFGHPDHWRELDYGYEGTACFKWAIPKMILVLGRLGCGLETKEVADLIEFLRKTLRPKGKWGASLDGNEYLTLRVLRSLMAVQEAGR